MPGYKTHVFGGMVAATGMVVALWSLDCWRDDPLVLAGVSGVCLLGALFPDVDTNSKAQHLFYGVLLILDGYLIFIEKYQWAAWVGAIAMLPAIARHRGWVHSWWAMLVVPLPIVLVPQFLLGLGWETFIPFYLAFVTGYFSHLFLDRAF